MLRGNGRTCRLARAVTVCTLALLALAPPAAQALTSTTFSYTGPPVPIPDAGDLSGTSPGAPATVTIPVVGLGTQIADVDFRIDGSACTTTAGATTVGISHTFVNDLEIKLTSPGGTTALLIDNTDGSGNNLCQVLLNDDSGAPSIQSVVTANAPFTGTWTPTTPLSAFDGQDPNGNWVVSVQDFFSSDTGNIRAVSVIVTPKAATTTVGTSSADVALGGSVSATALVTGRDTPIADNVDFDLFGPDDATCSQPPAFSAPDAAIDGAGAAASGTFAPPSPGTYRWRASYSGDANNLASSSGCGGAGQAVVVSKAVTKIAGVSSASTAPGGVISDTATVSGRVGASGDTVVFRLYGPDDATCSRAPAFTSAAVPVDAAGRAYSGTFTVTAPGTYSWAATYSGDANNAASSTPCGQGTQAAIVRPAVVCKSLRTVTVRLIRRDGLRRDLRGARIVDATLTGVGGAAVKQKFTKNVATVDLRGLPKGRYTIKVRIRQRNGKTFTFTRTYQTCEFPRSVSVSPNK